MQLSYVIGPGSRAKKRSLVAKSTAIPTRRNGGAILLSPPTQEVFSHLKSITRLVWRRLYRKRCVVTIPTCFDHVGPLWRRDHGRHNN